MLEKRKRNQLICEAVKDGASYAELAPVWGVSRSRIEQICRRAGVRSLTNRPLIYEEQEEIERLYWKGVRAQHIAQELGRSTAAVCNYLQRIGLRQRDNEGIARDEWGREEDDTVRRLYGAIPCRRIGEKLGRTKNEVIGRARRLGLSKSAVPGPAPNAHAKKIF